VAISGLSDNNLDVSVLMRNLDQSIWFGEPQLSGIAASNEQKRSFSLSVPVTKPKALEIEGK
jgi:type IV pilus assembly protein PilN